MRAQLRLAVVGLRHQHLRHVDRLRGVPAHRGPGAALVGVRRVASGGCRARRRRDRRVPARAVGRATGEASGDDRDGPGPVRRDGERPDRVRPRLAVLRPAAGRLGRLRNRGHRLHRRVRRVPEAPRPRRASPGREREIRGHELGGDRGGPAARWRADRVARPGRHRPADALSYLLSAFGSCASAAATSRPGHQVTWRRPARRVAVHPRRPRAAAPVPQLDPGRRPDHGHRPAPGRPPAGPVPLPGVAVRSRVRHPGTRRLRGRPPVRAPGGPPRPVPGHDRLGLAALALPARPRVHRTRASPDSSP